MDETKRSETMTSEHDRKRGLNFLDARHRYGVAKPIGRREEVT